MWARLTGKKEENEGNKEEGKNEEVQQEQTDQNEAQDRDRDSDSVEIENEIKGYFDEEEGEFVNAEKLVSSFEYDSSDDEEGLKHELLMEDDEFLEVEGNASFELEMIVEEQGNGSNGEDDDDDDDNDLETDDDEKQVDDDSELLSYADTEAEDRAILGESNNLLPSPVITPTSSKDEDDLFIEDLLSDKTIKRSNSNLSGSNSQSVENIKRQADDILQNAKSRVGDMKNNDRALSPLASIDKSEEDASPISSNISDSDHSGDIFVPQPRLSEERTTKTYTMEEVQSLLGGLQSQVNKLSDQVQDLEVGTTKAVIPSMPNAIKGETIGENGSYQIDRDLYAILMRSRVCSFAWLSGLSIYACQMGLIILICMSNLWFVLDNEEDRNDPNLRTPFNIPLSVGTTVRIAQFFALLLCLLARQEFISAIVVLCIDSDWTGRDICSNFILLCMDCGENNVSWHHLVERQDDTILERPGTADSSDDGNDMDDDGLMGPTKVVLRQHQLQRQYRPGCGLRFFRFVLPLLMKLIKGALALFVSMWIIIRSSDVLTLVKDLTALMVLCSVDTIFFILARNGYLTEMAQTKARECENVHVHNTTFSLCGTRKKITLRGILMFLTLVSMVTGWALVVKGQLSGSFLQQAYPYCNIDAMVIDDEIQLGNGKCDIALNIAGCNFDAGDCREFNSDEYKSCRAKFYELYKQGMDVDPSRIGDGMCDNEWPYNTRECRYDGFDCLVMVEKPQVDIEFEVPGYPGCFASDLLSAMQLGDGNCNIHNNSTECQYDGGDCVTSSFKRHIPGLPGCIAFVEWIGDGICNPSKYALCYVVFK